MPDLANHFQLTGPLVAAPGGNYYTAKGDLHGSGAPPTLNITGGLGAPGNVTGLDFEGGVLVIAVWPDSDTPVAGVWYAGTGGFVPLTQGGYLRRPVGVAIDPLRLDRVWVTDVGPNDAPANRLIRLDYDGIDWRQTIHAEFPSENQLHGIAISPVTFAPEPGALALGAAAIASVLSAARARGGRRARPSRRTTR